MLNISTGQIARVAEALISGQGGVVDKLIENAVSRAGERLVDSILSATPLGNPFETADRVAEALQTRGSSELDRMRNQWIASLRPRPPREVRQLTTFARRVESILQRATTRRNPRRRPLWERTSWAQSRQQWLNESWMHDWRSQPRRPAGTTDGGEWLPGRLPYPVGPTGYLTTSRRKRYVRRVAAQRRAAIRKTVRQFTSSWND